MGTLLLDKYIYLRPVGRQTVGHFVIRLCMAFPSAFGHGIAPAFPIDAPAPVKREKAERAATWKPGRGPPEGSLAWEGGAKRPSRPPARGEHAEAGEAGGSVEGATKLAMVTVQFSGSGGCHRACGDGWSSGRKNNLKK